MTAQHLRLAAALLATLLGGCAAGPNADTTREYLDPTSAATITVVDKPLVFYREHPELAVHMRDYVTVVAASVDRQGKTDYVLIAYFWTTFDAHGKAMTASAVNGSDHTVAALTVAPEKLTLTADDRHIELPLAAHSTREAGIGELVHAPPGRAFVAGVYRTDLPTLRYVAATRRLQVLPSANDSDSRFLLWDDQRPALDSFVRHISGVE